MAIKWKLLDQMLTNWVIVDKISWNFIICKKSKKTHHCGNGAVCSIVNKIRLSFLVVPKTCYKAWWHAPFSHSCVAFSISREMLHAWQWNCIFKFCLIVCHHHKHIFRGNPIARSHQVVWRQRGQETGKCRRIIWFSTYEEEPVLPKNHGVQSTILLKWSEYWLKAQYLSRTQLLVVLKKNGPIIAL